MSPLKVTQPNVFVSEPTRRLFERSERVFFLAACRQNLNKTSEGARLHRRGQKKGLISFATGLFQSTRFADKSALLSNKVHS